MQYMKLSDVERKNLMTSLAGMNDYLRAAFQSLTPEEALVAWPWRRLLSRGTGVAPRRPRARRIWLAYRAAAHRVEASLAGLRRDKDRA